MTNIKEVLHLYPGATIIHPGGSTAILIGVIEERAHFIHHDTNSYGFCSIESPLFGKIALRALSDMTEEDFYSFFNDVHESQMLIKGKINNLFCVGYFDKDEYDERVKDEMSVEPNDLIIELEESDYDNVWSWSKSQPIAHGTGDEMRFFIGIKPQAEWINHLLKRQLDIFGLIPAGLAIDKTKL